LVEEYRGKMREPLDIELRFDEDGIKFIAQVSEFILNKQNKQVFE
jgi:hypothetical protein